MIGDILQPTHLLIILLVALLVLGPKRLPEVGRSLGKGIRDFRGAMSGVQDQANGLLGMDEESESTGAAETPSTAAPATNGAAATTPDSDDEPSYVTGMAPSEPEPKAEPKPMPGTQQSVTQDPASIHSTGTPAVTREPDPSEYAD